MEIFYSENIAGTSLVLGSAESEHCVKVLRHRPGDVISVTDGRGRLYSCRISAADRHSVGCEILGMDENWGRVPYDLCLAVCPTKNADRFSNLVEKCTEMGVSSIVPLISRHSERRSLNIERERRIALSAMKQSLKARLPEIVSPMGFEDFVREKSTFGGLKLIAHCVREEMRSHIGTLLGREEASRGIIVMIGPEGDFSSPEISYAREAGFIPVSIGESRLRTETAAIVACAACYLHFSSR